jgi:peptidoglycan/LPS O-acetylase OafA/YrhL
VQQKQPYWPRLDGLRAFAVLAVLYTHYLPEKFWIGDVYWGGLGVRLFFVLSGFLISGILLREVEKLQAPGAGKSGKFPLIRHFYIRRYLRLSPVFLATLIVAAILDIPNTRETFWWHVFYVSNFNFAIHDSWQGQVAHFWTLAVEEQFYLLWPVLVLFLSPKALLRFIYLAIPAVLFYRLAARAVGVPDIAVWVLLPNSMDALCLGALLALIRHHAPWILTNWRVRLAGACGLMVWIGFQLLELPDFLHRMELGHTALALFFAWVVHGASGAHQHRWGKLLELRPLVYLGKISYGIYVIHTFVVLPLRTLDGVGDLHPVVFAGLCTVVTITLAMLSWHFLEAPINKLRKKISY